MMNCMRSGVEHTAARQSPDAGNNKVKVQNHTRAKRREIHEIGRTFHLTRDPRVTLIENFVS